MTTIDDDVDVVDNPNLISLPMLRNWGDDSWRKLAACRGYERINDFFPERTTGSDTPLSVARARMMCLNCPVRFECLKFAVENCIKHGTYGNRPPDERRGMTLDNITFRDTLVPLHKAAYLIRKATGNNPIPELSRITGESEEWVRLALIHAPDYLV